VNRLATRSHIRGFSLIESLVALAVAALLASAALPSMQGQRLRAGRLDAVAALTRVQAAQEQHFGLHGRYASELGALGLINPNSPQGLYALSLQNHGAEAYRATATPVGRQAQDGPCPALMLDVNKGYPTEGPSSACWQR
jgi:type IV pilus assembly protein PilE